MEELNKKTLLYVFIGFVLLQASFLLAISANFLLAQTDELTIEFSSIPPSTIYGENTISAVTNMYPDFVEFRIVGPQNSTFPGIANSPTNYYFLWDTISFPDGYYSVEAIAIMGTYEEAYALPFNVNVENYGSETASAPEITVRTENNQTVLQGMKYFYADISTGHSLNNLTFYFDNLNTSTVDDYAFGSGVSADLSSWSTEIDTIGIPDGQYKFYAKGYYENIYYDSQNYINVTIDNNVTNTTTDDTNNTTPSTTTGNELTIEFSSIPPSSIYGENTISAVTNMYPDFVEFRIVGPQNSTFTGIANSPTNYYFLWDTISFPDGYYSVEAIAIMGTYEEAYALPFNVNVENTNDNIIPSDETTTPLVITFLERFEPPLSGDQKISISANQEIFSCIFKIYGPRYAELPAVKNSLTDYHIILHTKDFPDGSYTIKAVAGNNIETAEIRLDIGIENMEEPSATETQTATKVYPVTETQFADEVYPTIKTDPIIYDGSIYPETFIFELPLECKERNLLTPEECQKYMSFPLECREQNILNPEECERFMMENFMPYECKEAGITTKEECDYLLRNTYTNFENFSTEEITLPYTTQTEEDIPNECKEQGITSFEECKKHMMLINMPEECRQAGTTNPDECDKIMFKKYGPQECIQAQIFNPEECEKFMFEKYAPDDCREVGILNPEACKKFMFEKYGGGEDMPTEKFPIECQKANAKTIEECERVMQKIYMPEECKKEGLENEQECEAYLQQKYMPEECLEAGVSSRQECDKIMFRKFGPPECKIAGIDDEKECEEFMFNRYAPKVSCDNVEDWQCKNFIKERHLGNIVAKQVIFNKIKENVAHLAGETVGAEELKEKIGVDKEIIPLRESGIKFRIIRGTEEVTLNEEDNLIQTAPIVLMIDSDEDGLPDDMEKRFGTDPFKADTDGDGHNDGEEIKNGHNPLGEGKFEKTLAPIEKVIMENKPLGHPATKGEEVKNFFVENINDMEDTQGNSIEGYVLSGMAKPNSVATLYIYSDLPIVVTVDTDQYGNWQYQLDQSLIEGEHEIYVAINDDTGKVIEKSKPLNFFVKEASAVSVKDFVSTAKASSQDSKESEISIYYYLLITLFMAIAGIFLFLAVIIGRKKNRPLQ